MSRRTVLLSLAIGTAVLAYTGARWALQTLDTHFRYPGGASGLGEAIGNETLLGVYRAEGAMCKTYESIGGEPVPAYAERLFMFRLDPLLRRRVVPANEIAVIVPSTVSADARGLELELEDGTRTGCCSARPETVPQRFWLVLNGERVCAYTFAGMPEAAPAD